ncbi:FadD3 family acyl-CoA ligase [Parafrankia sp. EUN1f]|uniref:FadD3 family acyl-CoA ligase n=1 Tax=Parafrankia sp. EUN1f TaxID=102897 RepID=UPI0001C474BE|nr:FadD3 family acyl-CoA ligase [Parafrankia sp. EUN1f]EFC79851.1 AMP-dependent synthetase and ligase [Parafrankia sp. EUN1f]
MSTRPQAAVTTADTTATTTVTTPADTASGDTASGDTAPGDTASANLASAEVASPETADGPEQVPATIPAALARAAARWPHDEAIVDGDQRLTFADLDARTAEVARALVASGVRAGDRVSVWAPNTCEWALVALGVYRAGAVLAPINSRFKGVEAARILRTAGSRLLFVVDGFLDTDYLTMLAEQPAPPALADIVLMGSATGRAGATGWPDFLARAEGQPDAEVAARSAALTGDDLSDIVFTSGTTGAPKGAMLTHGASTGVYTSWSQLVGLRHGDRYLLVYPFFHTAGLKSGLLACLLVGATLVPHPVFDVPSVLRRVAQERITMLPGPPAIYQSILNTDLAGYDLSSLRLAVTGAAAVPVELVRRLRSELGLQTVLTAYGLTETTGTATACRRDDDPETIAMTSGRAIPGVEVRIVDDTGAPLPPGEPGEIVIRGYNVMRGYFDNPDATAEAIDADGWLHSGDIGVQDEAGNIRITDRKKDMFIVGGFNAYPAEIEAMLLEHGGIAQVAVIGVPDERLGEVGMAFVIPRAGVTVDPAQVIAWSRERMANYKVPRRVEVVDALPLNATGKIVKYELRDRVRAAEQGAGAGAGADQVV